jgi:hypothetical protein
MAPNRPTLVANANAPGNLNQRPKVLPSLLRLDRRLAQECDHAQAARLMTAAYILTGLRVGRDVLAPIYDGVRIMHDSSAFELIEEGGYVKGEQDILLRLGRRRLGPPDEATVAALRAIKDLDRLGRLADAVLSAASWQELLATS